MFGTNERVGTNIGIGVNGANPLDDQGERQSTFHINDDSFTQIKSGGGGGKGIDLSPDSEPF